MPCHAPERRNGPAELQSLKESTRLSDAAIGNLVGGVAHVTVLAWRKGQKTPEYAYRVALQVLTTEVDERGRVTKEGIPLDAWDRDGREAEIISRVRPIAQLLAARG